MVVEAVVTPSIIIVSPAITAPTMPTMPIGALSLSASPAAMPALSAMMPAFMPAAIHQHQHAQARRGRARLHVVPASVASALRQCRSFRGESRRNRTVIAPRAESLIIAICRRHNLILTVPVELIRTSRRRQRPPVVLGKCFHVSGKEQRRRRGKKNRCQPHILSTPNRVLASTLPQLIVHYRLYRLEHGRP